MAVLEMHNLPKAGDCNCPDDAKHVCCCTVSVAAPAECDRCERSCSRAEMYAEIPCRGDWDGRGFVMRIGCVCDLCMQEDGGRDARTEFETYSMAIAYWNIMQAEVLAAKTPPVKIVTNA